MRWTLPLAALLFASLAQAADTPPAGQGRGSIDANRDGFVTRDEAKDYPRLVAQFDAADADKDGRLDAAEMQAHREAMRADGRAHGEERWKAADTDGDAAISRDEAKAAMPRLAGNFDKVDANGDGKVTREEMRAVRAQRKDRPGRSEQL
jgi:Ca2+-binding EF-hand superfamily protein